MMMPRVSQQSFLFPPFRIGLCSGCAFLTALVSITPLVCVAQSLPTELRSPVESIGSEPSDLENADAIEVDTGEADTETSGLETVDPSAVDADDVSGTDESELSTPADASIDTTTASTSRFFCQFTRGQYTVMYAPKSRPNEAFPWAIPQALGGGWSPELRCLEISRRLERYRPDGLLELQTAI